MKALNILDIKRIMTLLLLKESFDSFFFEKAEIVMGMKMTMDGKRNMAWYVGDVEDEEKKNITEFVRWMEVKKYIFEFIKGTRTPQKMVISLKADNDTVERFLKTMELSGMEHQMDFLLQFRFEQEDLHLVSGVARKEFSMDKSLEMAWDEYLEKILKDGKVNFTKII